nr:hypothetical protein [Candidatus Sigynarchaeota archaeon]
MKPTIAAILGGRFDRARVNPVIWPGMPGLEGELGSNINGPYPINVPGWIHDPLGKYYLYFAHHGGKYIRLAYADAVEGPYTVYKPGTLHLDQIGDKKHVASPEIVIDESERLIYMYFHVPCKGKKPYKDQGQMTFLATSRDGIAFTPGQQQLAPFYLRVFKHGGYVYGLAKNDNKDGILVRSRDGKTMFERGPELIPGFRHCDVLVREDSLLVFFTRVGDAPERILLSTVDITRDWRDWQFSVPVTILEPEFEWEGSKLPLIPSKHGSTGPANALRDPALLVDGNDLYLFYCVKGEQGIACAKFIQSGFR